MPEYKDLLDSFCQRNNKKKPKSPLIMPKCPLIKPKGSLCDSSHCVITTNGNLAKKQNKIIKIEIKFDSLLHNNLFDYSIESCKKHFYFLFTKNFLNIFFLNLIFLPNHIFFLAIFLFMKTVHNHHTKFKIHYD